MFWRTLQLTETSLPNDDLTNWKARNNILSILQKPGLNSPLMVIKSRAIFGDYSHHFFQTFPLPYGIFSVWQIIIVMRVTIYQGSM